MSAIGELQDYVMELEDDVRVLTRELLDLSAFIAVLADKVEPGLAQRFAEQMRFIREASSDIIEIFEGDR